MSIIGQLPPRCFFSHSPWTTTWLCPDWFVCCLGAALWKYMTLRNPLASTSTAGHTGHLVSCRVSQSSTWLVSYTDSVSRLGSLLLTAEQQFTAAFTQGAHIEHILAPNQSGCRLRGDKQLKNINEGQNKVKNLSCLVVSTFKKNWNEGFRHQH